MKFRFRTTLLIALLALIAATASTTVSAADEKSDDASHRNITSEWVLWSKRGDAPALEAAIKQHAAWRKAQGENTRWDVYQPIVGPDLEHYVIRSGEHAWADYDTNREWSMTHQAGPRYMQDVAPHVRHAEHYFAAYDTKHSHWMPDKGYRYFAVYTYHFKPGSNETVKNVLSKIHKAATDAKWPHSFGIDYTIGGKGGMNVVLPMKNLADMEEPDPSLMKVVAKSLGSEKAAKDLWQSFALAIDERSMAIYVHRPDLSTPE
ncbi:hypothetical protein [Oleiagrimonas soli]|uniref:Uncharacterized protein n=1 Tax=Oleiagrimonas soli TaxID=1543381 RepID=A0A099CW61_9GAMM|nr:hypothetical protein [Oleiagrimonas soli]KGI78203.1 hypothetical protein LF63_0107655 [Oleiagrimonas soli]MBB6183339.1 hypothetical protein [Oleiagrimonas soli]